MDLGFEFTHKQVFGSTIITQPLQVKLDVFAIFLQIKSAVVTIMNKSDTFSCQYVAFQLGIYLKNYFVI